MKEIKEKIVGQRVLSKEETKDIKDCETYNVLIQEQFADAKVSEVIKEIRRPRRIGNTWRLKPPYAEHALYVTIEAIAINGKKYPYEVFFHGKDISHRQWTDTLTLSWSEAFRKAIEYGFSFTSLVANDPSPPIAPGVLFTVVPPVTVFQANGDCITNTCGVRVTFLL